MDKMNIPGHISCMWLHTKPGGLLGGHALSKSEMQASPSDWIYCSAANECWPCKTTVAMKLFIAFWNSWVICDVTAGCANQGQYLDPSAASWQHCCCTLQSQLLGRMLWYSPSLIPYKSLPPLILPIASLWPGPLSRPFTYYLNGSSNYFVLVPQGMLIQ